ncbi:MAG: hypothetical protein WD231_01990 [Candidatus Woykebacteria bacterium]
MESTRNRVYKVIRREGDRLYSSFARAYLWRCEYKVDGRTIPRGESVLFAFQDLESAESYRESLEKKADIEVWEAKARGCSSIGKVGIYPYDWVDFWAKEKVPKQPPPKGTIACDSLQLVQRVA